MTPIDATPTPHPAGPARLLVRHFPVHDTGIGRAAGFANDLELIAKAEADRAALDPAVRTALDELDARLQTQALGL